jgi:hypothetical protein
LHKLHYLGRIFRLLSDPPAAKTSRFVKAGTRYRLFVQYLGQRWEDPRMFTSVVLVALTGFVAHEELAMRPTWLKDYSLASERGIAVQKPLAVFIGTGETGWDGIIKEGGLGQEAKELLATRYVCVYLDASKDDCKPLAKAFDISQGVGMVISDRSGKLQAFHHGGEMSATELEKCLRRYGEPDRVALTTETREDLQPRPVRAAPTAVRYAPVMRSC